MVAGREEEAVERVRSLTGGHGVHSVLECVGLDAPFETALAIARAGGAVGRVGVTQFAALPGARDSFLRNITASGGTPPRAPTSRGMPDVLEGRLEPGRVFDRTIGLEAVPDGYRAMDEREAIKVLVEP